MGTLTRHPLRALGWTLAQAAVLLLLSGSVAIAADQSCKGLFKVRSKNSNTPTTITFVNKAHTQRAILWLDFKGHAKDYAMLAPGQSVTLKTFLTHPWMVANGPGDCLQIVMPRPGGSRVELTEHAATSSGSGGEKHGSEHEQGGCWYAVYVCGKSKSVDGPGFTVKSDKYAGFDKGLYCNIGGPFDTRKDAATQIKRFGGEVRRSC